MKLPPCTFCVGPGTRKCGRPSLQQFQGKDFDGYVCVVHLVRVDPPTVQLPVSNRVGVNSLYRASYCEKLIKHGKLGYSFKSFAAVVKTTPKTVNGWLTDHPEFAEAKAIATVEALKWAERVGKQLMDGGRKGSGQVFAFWMKNQFDWKDKTEITGAEGGPLMHGVALVPGQVAAHDWNALVAQQEAAALAPAHAPVSVKAVEVEVDEGGDDKESE